MNRLSPDQRLKMMTEITSAMIMCPFIKTPLDNTENAAKYVDTAKQICQEIVNQCGFPEFKDIERQPNGRPLPLETSGPGEEKRNPYG